MNPKINKFLNMTGRILAGTSFILIAIISTIAVFYKIITPTPYDVQSLAAGWVDEAGEPFDLNDFGAATKEEPTAERVYYTITIDDIDTALVFRCRNSFANVYANGVLIHKDDTNIPAIYGSSPGSRWHKVALDSSDEPVEICLEVTACFSDTCGLVDNIYIGSDDDVSRIITTSRIPEFIISAFLQFFGIILLALYAYLKKRFKNTNKDMLYLGCASFFSAQWSSSESLLWQFFFGYSEVFHLLGYLSLTAIPLSFGLLAIHKLKGNFKTFSLFYSIVSSINLIVTSFMHVTGIVEFHYSLPFTHVLLIILIPIAVKLVYSYTEGISDEHSAAVIFILLIIWVISITTALIKYSIGSYNYSLYVRIAILCFLSCLIIYQLNQIVNAFSKGMKADMLHNLALTDHLTGLFNRTAFSEHEPDYNHLIDSFSPIGVIQFDVNNLKVVNDTLGHEKGDLLICTVAEGLKKAFPDNAHNYRMGGDEFLTIIFDSDPDAVYKAGIDTLNNYCNEKNKIPDLGFRIQIAHGFILIKGNKRLNEAIEEADVLMYENKKFIKSQTEKSVSAHYPH